MFRAPFTQESKRVVMSVRARRAIGVVLAPTASEEAEVPVAERKGGRPPLLESWMDPLEWFTRGAVARELNCHVSTVRRLETNGDLHPRIGDGGVRYFLYLEVRNLRERRARKRLGHAAEMRIAAFQLFDRGVAWQDVALQLHADPLRIHHLWELFTLGRRMKANDTDAE
jgi:hypothetical protein